MNVTTFELDEYEFDIELDVELIRINTDRTDESNDPPLEILEEFERRKNKQLPNIEEDEVINLNIDEEPCEIKIGIGLNKKQLEDMINFLQHYQDVFAWSYLDMPGLDIDIVEHHIPLYPKKPPIR